MTEVTLSMEAMQLIATAEDIILKQARKQLLKEKESGEAPAQHGPLKITIMDVVEEEDKLTFLVAKGQLGLALGKTARNLQSLKNTLGKEVKVLEYDEDVERFIRNLFKPHSVESVKIEGDEEGIFTRVTIKPEDKGKAIGKAGRNVNVVRQLARRHHNIQELKVE
jgi:transcription termination/antitermination protein NusA